MVRGGWGELVTEMLAAGGATLLLDQLSKRWVTRRGTDRAERPTPLLIVERTPHRGAAYRRFSSRAMFALLWLAALVAVVTLHRAAGWFASPVALVGLGVALGGAAGNLVDMVRLRYIVDFIGVRGIGVGNLADVAIIAGLATAFWPGG